MPRVLITGAAGFIGMHTAIKFLNLGWEVVGLDNINNYYSVKLKEDRLNEIHKVSISVRSKFVFYREDLNSDIWIELSRFKFDALIHLAAQAGVRYSLENPNAYLKSNILGFQKVLDFVVTQKIEKFLYASSSSVYGKTTKQPYVEDAPTSFPESYYAATKKANELMALVYYKTKKIKSVGLRFFTVYGPWGRPDMAPYLFTQAAFAGQPIKVFNNGIQKRDFTYIDDIVQGIVEVVHYYDRIDRAEILNIGRGSPICLLEFIDLIEKILLKEIQKELLPAQVGDVLETYADISELKRITGYQPKINLDQGLFQFIEWYKEYNGY